MTLVTPVMDQIGQSFPASVDRLLELLRFASVGTDPRHEGDTKACAHWLAEQLAAIGMDASVHPGGGMPIVLAHDRSAPADAPRLLYYGHYDVQPPDPLELWDSPPFEPVLVDGPHGPRVVARGAADDKGQLMAIVEALRAWKAVHGSLPVRATVLLEGEEESGSASLGPFLEANRQELAADVCLISDTGMLGVERPAITYRLRGICYAEVTLHGPSHDLHSGDYGGAVANPLNALCRIVAELHDARGRVQVPGFYVDVREIAPTEAEAWRRTGFDERAFLADAGLDSSAGEAGRSVLERVWSRPTCDLHGISGGYIGAGGKTIIPASASAKLSCRLVPDQDPVRVMAGLREFIASRTPPGCRLDFHELGSGPAVQVPVDTPWMAAARGALADVFGTPPALIGSGGSIPVVASLKRILGLDTVLLGFGLDDDRIHGPNEKFELVCYRRAVATHAALLGRLAELRIAAR
jgi:acetylornithine deacetylase/succinyl-diaminopimelate desuccinylase-like protein